MQAILGDIPKEYQLKVQNRIIDKFIDIVSKRGVLMLSAQVFWQTNQTTHPNFGKAFFETNKFIIEYSNIIFNICGVMTNLLY
ncbi:hypothetical protein Q4Q39_15390 [Flavivirga amylovorans]|uniref:Uncharacterized protein n=1 Tax=Flavivirga amylovorans TaxID=870486 RepID=A0ABT8X535_9FLAO|nr:hypothetical protein [Flavivirga amylovorans]MDO5988793.1 hypothetical protein [Flavivirga amylovorans]